MSREKKNIYKSFHRKKLKNILRKMLVWEGLPDTIDENYLNDALLFKGYVGGFSYKGNIVVSEGALAGLKLYSRPVDFNPSSPFINLKKALKIDEECFICYNTPVYKTPETFNAVVEMFADRLTEIALSIDTSVKNSKVCVIPVVDNKEEAIRVTQILEQMYEGESAVLSYKNKSFNGENGIQIFPIKAKDNIVVKELKEAFDDIMCEFYEFFGIKCNTMQNKRERVNLSEMNSNDDQIEIARHIILDPREKWADEMNAKFGCNISVKYRESEEKGLDNPVNTAPPVGAEPNA